MKKQTKEVKIKEFVIRMTKEDRGTRALLIAKAENGQEYTFEYYDGFKGVDDDLIVNERYQKPIKQK